MAEAKRGQVGRPRLAPEAQRSHTLHVRLTPAEAAIVTERAGRAEIPLSAFLRRMLLGRRVEAAPTAPAFAYAADLARLAADLRRLERLALAGRIVGVPVEAVEQLHAHLHGLGLAALGIEEGPTCWPSSSRAGASEASSAMRSRRTTTQVAPARKSPC